MGDEFQSTGQIPYEFLIYQTGDGNAGKSSIGDKNLVKGTGFAFLYEFCSGASFGLDNFGD